MWHYYHFVAEDLLGGLAALATVPRGKHNTLRGHEQGTVARRLVVPWESNWRDHWKLNEMVASSIFKGGSWPSTRSIHVSRVVRSHRLGYVEVNDGRRSNRLFLSRSVRSPNSVSYPHHIQWSSWIVGRRMLIIDWLKNGTRWLFRSSSSPRLPISFPRLETQS